MGDRQSKNLDSQESTQSEEWIDISVLEDLMVDILSFVPSRDLIKNCRLVCNSWKDIVDGQSVWISKCENAGISVPKCKKGNIQKHYYRYVYLYMQSKGNFIKNPCGEDKYAHWQLLDVGGDEFAIENPPAGAEPIPPEVGSQSCFATSYSECCKIQSIDLYENVFNKYLLQNEAVYIKVGEWWAARFDCACEYNLTVILFDSTLTEVDEFSFKGSEQQWNGREWHLVTHTFHDVSTVRYVRFQHSGKDHQFWAGHYGSKMTGAFVEFELAL